MFDSFISSLRNVSSYISPLNDSERKTAKKQQEVSARSGNNITMGAKERPMTGIGDKYTEVLKDAIKFYQGEFKVTPRANIISSPERLRRNVLGFTNMYNGKTGQYIVNLRNITDEDADYAREVANIAESIGWTPKNTHNISHTPVHELGHVLTYQLFPDEKSVYKLYMDSLKDIGADLTSPSDIKAKTKEVSEYATSNPYEAVAESLVDYYSNRGKASRLSKAITKRMKNKGAMYGLTQSGGVADRGETFAQNLRRYSAIQ